MKGLAMQAVLCSLIAGVCFFSGMKVATATESAEAVRSEATRRLDDLLRTEDRLNADIQAYNLQIQEYQRAIESKRLALQQIRNEIKNIQIAFRWF